MKTAVIYARYSSDSQTEQSIEGQLRVCKEYAKANNILIVDTYIDRAMTGTNDNRAAFQKMLTDSSKKQWQYVIVYKLDRFSRDKYESVIHKKTLRDNGVTILSAMEQITDSPEGRMMETILEGFNQYFSEELRQKVIRGLKESWSKGKGTGGFEVFGYDTIDKRFVINEYEAEIVRETFTKYAQGYKVVKIAKDFEKRGLRRKNGKLIDHKYLYFMLHNQKYTGVVVHQNNEYDNIYPRIISDELWQKVDAVNQANKLAPSHSKDAYGFILTGKLICGVCKHRMGGESGTSHTGVTHYYYSCLSKKRNRAECNATRISKHYIEDLVINATVQMLSDEKTICAIAKRIAEIHKRQSSDNTVLKVLEKKRQEAFKAQSNMVKAIEQGIITEATKTRLTELESEISQLDIDIAKEKAKTFEFLSVEEIEEYLKKYMSVDVMDADVRKLIVNTFIREIILYENKVVITYNFTDNSEYLNLTKEHILEVEQQIALAEQSALSFIKSSSIIPSSAPLSRQPLLLAKRGCFFVWQSRFIAVLTDKKITCV